MRVWFQLVDAKGKKLPVTDFVELSQDALVAHLRNAVQKKFKKLYFSNVASTDLIVYSNKVPVYSNAEVCGLGRSIEEALIIAKPREEINTPLTVQGKSLVREMIENIPIRFRTERSKLVNTFMDKLFPDDNNYRSLLLVQAPPYSGKSVLCELLYSHLVQTKPEVVNLLVRAHTRPASMKFSTYFKSIYNCDLKTFWHLYPESVVLIDDAHTTFDDDELWLHLLQNLYTGSYKGHRVVLFSNLQAFEADQRKYREPRIEIKAVDTFSLVSALQTPGLLLSREELNEMIGDHEAIQARDLVWKLSSGHIGIAHLMLMYLDKELFQQRLIQGPYNVITMEKILHSAKFIKHCVSALRIPKPLEIKQIIGGQCISDSVKLNMNEMIEEVALGTKYRATSPDDKIAVDNLIRCGFLYEDNYRLHLPSYMHMKIWQQSKFSQTHKSLSDHKHKSFIAAYVLQLNGSRLKFIMNKANSREKEMQQEMHRVAASHLAKSGLQVIPQTLASDGSGFNGLFIQGPGANWRWEIIVHENAEGGMNYSTRIERQHCFESEYDKYAIFDFRRVNSIQQENAVCIKFTNSCDEVRIDGFPYPLYLPLDRVDAGSNNVNLPQKNFM